MGMVMVTILLNDLIAIERHDAAVGDLVVG
jgi:hypothetical protein